MLDEQLKSVFKSKKSYLRFAESMVISVIETAILHGKMSIEEFTDKPFNEIKDILLDTVKACTNKDEELLMLSKNRDALLQRNIELRLEQQAVTEQLRQIDYILSQFEDEYEDYISSRDKKIIKDEYKERVLWKKKV